MLVCRAVACQPSDAGRRQLRCHAQIWCFVDELLQVYETHEDRPKQALLDAAALLAAVLRGAA